MNEDIEAKIKERGQKLIDRFYLGDLESKRDLQLNAIVYDLRYQYPTGVTTFSSCANDDCNNSARGGRLCPDCLVDCLSALTGKPAMAQRLKHLTEESRTLVAQMGKESLNTTDDARGMSKKQET